MYGGLRGWTYLTLDMLCAIRRHFHHADGEGPFEGAAVSGVGLAQVPELLPRAP
jgi:hypothetical protein